MSTEDYGKQILSELLKMNETLAKIPDISKRLEKIENVFNLDIFRRLLANAEMYLGIEEDIMKYLTKSYGFEKKYSGESLLPEILEYFARKKERQGTFVEESVKGLSKLFIEGPVKFFAQVAIILILTFGLLFGGILFCFKAFKIDDFIQKINSSELSLKDTK